MLPLPERNLSFGRYQIQGSCGLLAQISILPRDLLFFALCFPPQLRVSHQCASSYTQALILNYRQKTQLFFTKVPCMKTEEQSNCSESKASFFQWCFFGFCFVCLFRGGLFGWFGFFGLHKSQRYYILQGTVTG